MSGNLKKLMQPLLVSDCAEIIIEIPYASFLGLTAQVQNNILIIRMPFTDDLIGHPQPQRLHGGVIGGMLEFTCALTVLRTMMMNNSENIAPTLPKPLNISLDYLRAGQPQDTFATATPTRIGRRIANVRAEAWQGARDNLITSAHMNLVLD
jgi:acyl-coenzyme A thioesterase PaaI-like protein